MTIRDLTNDDRRIYYVPYGHYANPIEITPAFVAAYNRAARRIPGVMASYRMEVSELESELREVINNSYLQM